MQVGAASTSLESAAFDSESKKKFVLWLAMERERRHKAEMTLNDASEVGQLSRMFPPNPRRAPRLLDAAHTDGGASRHA
jgi:hypothetical protein